MLLNINKLIKKLSFKINGIIHIGAGSGAELREYRKTKIDNFLMIEPDIDSYRKLLLRKYYYSLVFKKNIFTENCLITDKTKSDVPFRLMNVKDCNSIFDLHLHKKIYPKIHVKKIVNLKSKTLNSLFEQKYNITDFNFINIDIQGAELLAFKGADEILGKIEGIYTEVNFEELYKDCALIDQIDQYLKRFKFKRIYTNNEMHSSWGDALYIKE